MPNSMKLSKPLSLQKRIPVLFITLSLICPPVFSQGKGSVDFDANPAATRLTQLTQQEALAEADAIAANNYADAVADSVAGNVATSDLTGDNMSRAIDAAATQEFLINFGSMMSDLASVGSFLSDLGTGKVNEDSLIKNVDKLLEAAKDGVSLADSIESLVKQTSQTADAVDSANGKDTDNQTSSDIASAFYGVKQAQDNANDFFGTNEGLTDINSLKSDLSDVISLIEEASSNGKVDKAALGQLIVRIGKGFAQADLKKRLEEIQQMKGSWRAV